MRKLYYKHRLMSRRERRDFGLEKTARLLGRFFAKILLFCRIIKVYFKCFFGWGGTTNHLFAYNGFSKSKQQ